MDTQTLFSQQTLKLVQQAWNILQQNGAGDEILSVLHKREERLWLKSMALEHAVEGVVITDALQNDGPIIYCNPAFLSITGYELEEVVGRNCRFLQGPETSPETMQRVREAIRAPHSLTIEIRNYRKDGTPFWNRLSIAPLFSRENELTHFIGIQTDVTRRIEAEQALAQTNAELEDRVAERTRELEDRNAELQREMAERKQAEAALIHAERLSTIGTIAAGIAHEYNNLHGGLFGIFELLKEMGGLPDEAKEWVDLAMLQLQRATSSTKNLLAFSRKQAAERSHHSLNEITENTLAILRKELSTAEIELEWVPGEAPLVLCDPGEIGQVIMNMVINASHACLGSDTRKIRLETCQQDEMLELCIEDTGVGITPEKLQSIFEPFFTTKGEKASPDSPLAGVRGTGLGLSVCQTIISAHGGRIEAESTPGAGTTFRILLPTSP